MPKVKKEINKNTKGKSKSTVNLFFSTRNIALFVILLVLIFIWKFKGYFIVATVNGQPISRFELSRQLMNKFGPRTLDNIISEKLILAAVRQKGVFITTDEIDNRIEKIEKRLQKGLTLSDALKTQGLTENSFRRQIEIQLSIEKLFGSEATASAQEVKDYIGKNPSLYKKATDEAVLKEEVRAILRRQKISQLFDGWFSEIRKGAKIKKFL